MTKTITIILCLLLCINITAQSKFAKNASSHPRLVVLINVDELQVDHFLALRDKFSRYGFNRLLKEGTCYINADYGTLSAYSGTKRSTLLTGTYPAEHGIISNKWYNQNNDDIDTPYKFSGYDNTAHPDSGIISDLKLNGTTITDELLLFTNNKSKVASIGISPDQVVYNNGHKHSDMFWFDRSTGNMTTQADTILPKWVADFNQKTSSNKYTDRQWGPLSNVRTYHEYTNLKDPNIRHFLYNIKAKGDKIPYNAFANSPYINVLLRDFAASLLVNDNYGKDNYTDFLSINFTCNPHTSEKEANSILSAEQEDMLLRLDNEIASLLKFIETQVGKEHAIVVLTSTPNHRYSKQKMKVHNLDTGTFNGQKTSALLNLYLMAVHGQGKWVLGYHDRQFYLNHTLLRDKKMKLSEIRQEASEFLLDVAGIQKTMSASLLCTNNYTSGIYHKMQNSYTHKRSGDIIISLSPGWSEESDLNMRSNELINYNTKVPLIFWGAYLPKRTITRKVNMIDVASSLSILMNIPITENNEGTPLQEVSEGE